MPRISELVCALGCVLASGVALAQDNAVAAKVGALGLGVRAGLNTGGFGFNASESGIAYDFDLDWDSLSLAIDFHPGAGPFRVTAGVLRNDNGLDAVSRPESNVVIGGTLYTPAQVGTLAAKVSFDKTSPFLGLGWDWSRRKRAFGLSFDLGVLDQGAPRVSLRADGGLAASPLFAADVAREQAELRRSLESYDVIPYATLGFVFRF
jgi:hypothetical protein